MEKTLKLGAMSQIAQVFMANWEKEKDNIKLSAKGLYALLGIRNACVEQYKKIQETALQTAKTLGGEEQGDGSVKIPDDKLDEFNRQMNDLQNQDYELSYSAINLRDDDNLPVAFMDILFDFIEMK